MLVDVAAGVPVSQEFQAGFHLLAVAAGHTPAEAEFQTALV